MRARAAHQKDHSSIRPHRRETIERGQQTSVYGGAPSALDFPCPKATQIKCLKRNKMRFLVSQVSINHVELRASKISSMMLIWNIRGLQFPFLAARSTCWNHTMNHTMNRTVNRTMNRTMNHTMNRKMNRTMNHTMNRAMNHTINRTINRTMKRLFLVVV